MDSRPTMFDLLVKKKWFEVWEEFALTMIGFFFFFELGELELTIGVDEIAFGSTRLTFYSFMAEKTSSWGTIKFHDL